MINTNQSPPYTGRAVANSLIGISLDRREPLTQLKLQKLIYIAHGRCLYETGIPLVNEPLRAWVWGPVIVSVYADLRGSGKRPLRGPIFSFPEYEFTLSTVPSEDTQTINLLKRVWTVFSGYSAQHLSELTHKQGSPWFIARQEAGIGPMEKAQVPINNDLIASYFATHFLC